jgi:molybdenum cofactor biosynthesis protein B
MSDVDRGVASPSVGQHRAEAAGRLRLAVLTVSDTRTLETDTSGRTIVEMLEAAGHRVLARAIVRDEPDAMRPQIEEWRDRADVDAVLVSGGTGVSPRDRTVDTVEKLLTATLPGFGELFRMLSYAEIGPACILSRAIAGLMHSTPVFVMPGSRAAVALAMERIIVPELPHIVTQARPR